MSLNPYLAMLTGENSEKALPHEPTKLTQGGSVGFVSAQHSPVSDFLPSLDAEGVPCGCCPSCRHGDFWRWPKSHPDHQPNGWRCYFCSPPPDRSGPLDFCGVPEGMDKR